MQAVIALISQCRAMTIRLERFLPIHEMKQHVKVELVAHQLRAHFIHVLLGVLIREA